MLSMDALLQDLRYAYRALVATPIVSAAAILSLTLAIGANTAIFSLISALLLRPLPVDHPERLALVSESTPGSDRFHYPHDTFDLIRQHDELFDGALGFPDCCGESVLTVGSERQLIHRLYVAGDSFSTLGVRPERGRLPKATDDVVGAAPVLAISDRLWRQRFHGRDDVVGSVIMVDGIGFTIIGVLPPDFFGVEVGKAIEVAVPVRMAGRLSRIPWMSDAAWLNIVVRLKEGVSFASATVALRALQADIRTKSLPQDLTIDQFLRAPFTLEPFDGGATSGLRQQFRQPLMALFAVVGLVLVIACVNVGNLLVARGMARRHELSVRTALGASPARLVRQVFLECLLLSATSVGMGLALTSWISTALVSRLSTVHAPIALDARVDGRVLLFAIIATVTSTLLFGIAPSWRASRVAPAEALNRQGRTVIGGRTTLTSVLIAAQVTLAVVLAVTAGLLTRTFVAVAHTPSGFDAHAVLTASINGMAVPLAERNPLFSNLASAIADMPGVAAAGISANPPLIGSLLGDFFVSTPGTAPAPDAEAISRFDTITPGLVAAYGMRIVAGRDLARSDVLGSQSVMLVNEAFARQMFPGQPLLGVPLALTVRTPQRDVLWQTRTVVGVVSDVAYRSLRDPAKPMIYVPLAQREPTPQTGCVLVVRSTAPSGTLMRNVSAVIAKANPNLTVTYETLSQQIDESLAQDRMLALLSTSFSGLALLLAGVGLYGVTSYTTHLRRREIGVRIALGATTPAVVTSVMAGVLRLIAFGIALGVVISLWATQFLASLLFGVRPRDVSTYVAAALLLTTVGCVAAWLPARRAAQVDPMIALRAE